ncbi:dephospho-CoA kinase [Terrabacter sp. 2RAF25]|uniref:dephospho-CoA kinase n=1 Tax=Terrabacter sp. 2RAF25 TaxID=3232998 RepID=UPI003F9A699B
MLRVGVTGGIGSGKSTVSRRLGELGAHVVDADAVGAELAQPGQPTLEAIRERFGEAVIRPDGSLDRAGMAAVVFADPDQLAALDAITGPAIVARVRALRAAAPAGAVSVYDMPLLVERGLWVHEHLSVVVETDEEVRVRRLVDQRGLDETDARRRIASQATDAQRRAVADVVLPNDGTPEDLERVVDALWEQRLAPYAANLASGTRSRRPDRASDCVVEPRVDWEARAGRVVARLAAALAPTGVVTEVSHVGSTSVPGLLAKDVLDVQVGVHRLADVDEDDVRESLVGAGYVFNHGIHSDTPHPEGADASAWLKQFLGGCDPGNHVHVHVREHGSAGWRFALLFRDWLRHEPREREAYAAEKRRLLEQHPTTSDYVVAKEPWFEGAWQRANAWAERTDWQPR